MAGWMLGDKSRSSLLADELIIWQWGCLGGRLIAILHDGK